MPIEEYEQKQEASLPRISVRMPEPATWRLDDKDLLRYGSSVDMDDGDPDVEFRKKVDSEYDAKVKEAFIVGLVDIVLDRDNNQSLLTSMLRAERSRIAKEKELLKRGVLPTEISHAADKFFDILKIGEKGTNTFFLNTGSGSDEPFSTLKIQKQTEAETENEFINISLTQKQGPWTGQVEVNVPLHYEATNGLVRPDAVNSKISNANGTLSKIEFVEAADLIIDTANSAANDFERALREADSVFKDAEAHHG